LDSASKNKKYPNVTVQQKRDQFVDAIQKAQLKIITNESISQWQKQHLDL